MFFNWQKSYITLLFASLIPLISTQSEAQVAKPCTPSIEPAITVTVFNSRTKKPIEANVVVEDGKFQEVLKVFGATASGQTIYGGAFERPGVYTLRTSKNGYKTTILRRIRVSKDECHVLTRKLNIGLEPIKKRRK